MNGGEVIIWVAAGVALGICIAGPAAVWGYKQTLELSARYATGEWIGDRRYYIVDESNYLDMLQCQQMTHREQRVREAFDLEELIERKAA